MFGGLFLGHPEAGVFGERAERIAVGIAGQAAVALETSRLFAQVGRELAQRRDMEERLREEERRKDEFLATSHMSCAIRWRRFGPPSASCGWPRTIRRAETARLRHRATVVAPDP